MDNYNKIKDQYYQMYSNIKANANTQPAYQTYGTNNRMSNSWFSGSQPTSWEIRKAIGEISLQDQDKGNELYNQWMQEQMNPNSPYYNKYATATNKAKDELAALGVNAEDFTLDWFKSQEANDFMNTYLERSSTSDSAKAPTKKSSRENQIAYWLDKWGAGEAKTQSAEKEYQDIMNKAKYMAGDKARNYSDDEIIQNIYGVDGESFKKNYPTLYEMYYDNDPKNYDNEYKAIMLNRAIDFSEDMLRGSMWAARNDGGTGNAELDTIMAAMGAGNTWQDNSTVDALLNPKDPNFLPYAVGSTNLDDEAYLFGQYTFSKEWIAENDGLQYEDSKRGKAFRKVLAAEDDTVAGERAREGLYKWIELNKDSWDTPEEAKEALDTLLANRYLTIGRGSDMEEYDLAILNKIDETIGKGEKPGTGDLIAFNRPINYKYDNVLREISNIATANANILKDADTRNDIADDFAPTVVKTPDTRKPAGTDGIDAVSGADVVHENPVNPIERPTSTVTPPRKYTEEEKQQIKFRNKKIKDATELTSAIMTDDEAAVMKNAGSVAFKEEVDFFKEIRTSPEFVKRYAEKTLGNGTKSVINSCLDSVHDISEYETTKANLEADRKQFAEYELKYGPLETLQETFEPTKTVQIGDFSVTLVYHDDPEDEQKGYTVQNITAPGRSGMSYEDLLDYDDSGVQWATDILNQADEAANEETNKAKALLEFQNTAMSKENADEEIKDYKQLSARINKEQNSLAATKDQYDSQKAVVNRQVEKLRMARAAAATIGMDTSKIDQAFDFLGSMVQFYNEPQLPVQDMSKLEYMDYLDSLVPESISSKEKITKLHETVKDIDSRIKEIDDDIAYANATGYQIPDRYAKNMKKTREDLENERKAIEYELIAVDSDADKLRAEYEAGKAFEKKYGEGNMNYWVHLFSSDDFKTLRLQDRYSNDKDVVKNDVVTKDEEKVYYALLGRKVLELGENLDNVLQQIGTNPQAVQEILREVFSDAAEYQHFMENEDTGFGMWANREYDRSVEYGRELVESGLGGGIQANAMATIGTVGESISSAWYTLDRLITGKRFNKKSSALRVSGFKNETREATRESINEYYKDNPVMKWVANLGYEVYCNHGDSTANAILLGSLMPNISNPIINEFLGSMPMGATAGLNDAIEAIENGASTEQAWLTLGASFIANTVSEAVTRSNIMGALGETGELTKDTIKNAAVDWLTSSGIEEMIGETATDVFQNYINQKATEWFDNPNYESDHQKRIDAYYAEGYTAPGEAEAKAYEEEIKNYVHTAFVSYISAGTNVLTRVGKAAVNTVTAVKDVVNGYRLYTKGDQKLGGSNSTLTNLKNDLLKRNNVQRPAISITNRNVSGQEAGAAAPGTSEAPAPVTTADRLANAEQGYATANEAYASAKADYDTAYTDERRKRKALTAAKKEVTAAEKSGNQARIVRAQAALDNANQEYDAAKSVKERARARRNEASSALESATAERESAANAYNAEKATPEQKQASADVLAIGRIEGSAQTTQTEMIASILDNGDGNETVTEQASAAAAFLGKYLGDDASFVVQQVMSGTANTGISREVVTTALQNAALGNGAATALIQSEQFKNAAPEEKAQMLAATVEQDQNDAAVQSNIANSVKTYRTTMGVADLASQGHFDQAKEAQDKAGAAAADTADARTELEARSQSAQAANEAAVEANNRVIEENASDDSLHEQDAALAKVNATEEVEKQAKQHLAKMEQAQQEADATANKAKEDAMTSAREIANQTVAQQDQQRANEAAAIAEQQRQEAEAAAQAQAQQDEMTGKADEDRRAALVEQLLDNENLQGEERDARREKLMNQLDKVKVKITDLKQSVSNTEGRLALYAFERKLGIPIQFADLGPVDSQRITRGKYENGTIYLNENLIKSGKMTVGQALVEASLHEIIHSVRNTNAYNSYRNVVMNALYGARNSDNAVSLYNENSDYRAAIDTMIADRAAAGDPNFTGDDLNRMIEIADEEIVADFARMNLAEKDVVQRLMDAGMGGKMRNTLHNINQALKNYFGNLTGEERRTAETLRRAERNLQKAINEAAETSVHPEGGQFSISQFAQSAGLNFDQNTLVLTDQNGNVIDGVNNKVTADMMNNTPVGLLIDLARDGAKTKNGNVKFESTISAETAQAQKQMFADLMNMVAQYKDSDLVWEIASSTMFSALKSNSDPQYSTTVDFGTVCAKTQEIINVMSQVMLEKGRGLTREEVLKVYNETANANLTVPCPVCYVFSRWMGVPSLLNQMSQYQKRFVALNDDGSINMEKTGENANTYIKSALEKYGSKDKIDDAKVSLVNRMKTQEKNRTAALAVLNSETATAEEKAKAQTKHDEAIKNLDNLQKELGEVEAYNWVTQALCLQQQKGKTKYNVLDKNGNYVIDPSFELTPDNVLFDLRQTGEFAKYTKNWQYRNTRGAGMGKAIMPYSGESIGDIIYGTNRKSEIMNPFLTQTYAKAADGIKNAINRAKQQNLIGGQRLQSTSDFRPEWGLDYMMAFLELQAVGSKVQMYTKVAEAVDLLASMGGDINLSIMGKGQGWHVDENGNQVLDFSDVTGMDYETAKALKDQYDNVQMILVGMNDTHIKLALANPDIDFVIPWHSSGNSKDTLASLVSSASQGEEQLETSSDYTDTQSDKESENQTEDQKKLWNLRMKILQGQKLTESDRQIILADDYLKPLYERFTVKGKDDDCYKVKLAKDQAKQIFPYEYWNKSLTKDEANKNGQAFIDYCQHFGIVPRFSGVVKTNDDGTFSVTGNFAGAIYDENGNITGYDPNLMYDGYWKVLIDRPMYDNKDNYRDQQVVDVTKAKIGALENGKLTNSDMPLKTSAMYGPNYSTQEKTAVDNSLAAIEQMEQARMNGGKQSVMGDLTAADQDLMTDAVNDYEDAVARQDWKAAQEDVDFYAEQNGFDTQEKAYHGTDSFGFTEFDMEQSQDMIFVAYSKDMAGTYVSYEDPSVKKVSEAVKLNKPVKEMNGQELFEAAKKYLKTIEGSEVLSIDYDPKSDMYTVTTDESNYFDPNATVTQEFIEYDIKHYLQSSIDELSAGIYQFYTRPGKQLVIDADTTSWDDIPVQFSDETMSTREIAEWARNNGYDSVRINGIWDYGGNGPDLAGYGDIGIFFNQKDVKSADLVTYDDNGNVIPLDQRFSDSPDIRYSTEGELTEADRDLMEEQELNQYMADRGIITPEELTAYQERTGSRPLEGQNPTMSTAQGPAQRAFGDADGMLRNSDEIAGFAKAVVEAQNSYFPDTNNEQVHRAISWIRSLKQTPNSDGYAEALNAVTKEDFDYRSADGQARMVAVMGMAVARNDTMAQVALADAFNRQGTDLGRALQARKLFKLMTPAGRISTLQKMIDNYNVDLKKKGEETIKFSHWVYEAAAAAETADDFHQVLEVAAAELAAQLPISWKERLNSLRMVSMLANPRTHIRNIVGNALFVPAVGMKNKIGAVLEKAFVKKGERTKTLAPILNKEIREFARQDAREIRNVLTGEAKYDENTLVQRAKNPLGPVLGVLSDFNSWALEGEDWLFLRGHYRRALGSWMQANGYTVEQVKNDKALLEKGRQYAINEAQKATYRDFNGVAQKLNQLTRDAKTPGQKAFAFGVNAVLPFKKTPANILKRGIEYSPLGIARSVYNLGRKFMGGDVTANQVIDQFTAGLSGTAVMALGYLLAGTGAVSCGFDDDDWPEELKGKQKYSINPGQAANELLGKFGIPKLFGEDVTYTMDWAAPMAMPFFVGASIRNQTDQEGWDVNKVLDAMTSITEPVFNLSMLDGVNSLFKINSYSNQNPATQIGAKIISNYASSYVPSVLGAIARIADDTQRKSYVKKEDKKFLDGVFNYAWETAENKIPGASRSNIPVRDVWGRAKVTDLAERILENLVSPGYVEHVEDDPVVNELGRLFDSTHSKYIEPEHADQSIDGKGLEAEVYDTYDRVHGETQYSMLKDLFNSKEYQELTNDDAKVEAIRKVYSYAKEVARGAIDEDYWYEKQTADQILRDGIITDYKSKMMQCIEKGNWEYFDTYVKALREEGVEDSAIKDKISKKYCSQWKDAYRKYLETEDKKYDNQMKEIEELLDNTGFKFNIYGKNGWKVNVDKEY